MRAEQVTAYLLGNSAAVVAIVGSKITAVLGPQADQAPLVVYWKDGADHDNVIAHNGPVTVRATMSVQIVTKDYQTLKALGEAVRLAFSGQYGNIAGVDVNSIQVMQEGPDFFQPELDIYGQQWQFLITHQE